MSNINVSRIVIALCIFCLVFPFSFDANAASLPPDPDNAALLYYQACMLKYMSDDFPKLEESVLPEAPPSLPDSIKNFISDLDKATAIDIKEHKEEENLKIRRKKMKLVEAAVRIPNCNWGILFSQRSYLNTDVMIQLGHLEQILIEDARTLADKGQYRQALERCLTIRKFAHHVGDDNSLMYLTSSGIDKNALTSIQYVLGLMPDDVETLIWLQGQLATVKGSPESPARSLWIDFEYDIERMRNNPESYEWWKKDLTEKAAEDENLREEIEEVLNLTHEELIARASDSYSMYLNSFIKIMSSEKSYENKYKELKLLVENLERNEKDPAFPLLVNTMMLAKFESNIRYHVIFNALKAAIEIYLIKAQTGQLPEQLPEGLPKDPYSGRDFEYEITENGFVLRCRVKPIDLKEKYEFEYKIKKESR